VSVDKIIEMILTLDPILVYILSGFIAFLENIFPPFPSDVAVVAAGYLCASERINVWVLIAVTTLGSTLGFMTMFKIGAWFGKKIVETHRIKFLNLEKIHIVEAWFGKYGYLVVVVNRFLSGTRSVISFFTGMSELSFGLTSALACVSSLVWYTILIFAGKSLGDNWRSIVTYLQTYGRVVFWGTIILAGVMLVYNYFKKKRVIE
jgi:membrane protein DedA with SNARE-associated domain